MSTERNKAVVQSFYEHFGASDRGPLEQVLARDLAVYAHGAEDPQGLSAHLDGIRTWTQAFEDSRYTIEAQVAEGDLVATRVVLSAAHARGPFMGVPPSGRPVRVAGMSFERVTDGKIRERHVAFDRLGLLRQLGLLPTPGEEPSSSQVHGLR